MIGRLSDEEINDVLRANVLGKIACSDHLRPYIVPISYVFDGRNIICHSVEGMKINIMRSNPSVCLLVDEIQNYSNWRSVIAWGEYHELTDERERYNAMKLFTGRMMYLKISETAVLPEQVEERERPRRPNVKPVIYRIVLTEKTGRYEIS